MTSNCHQLPRRDRGRIRFARGFGDPVRHQHRRGCGRQVFSERSCARVEISGAVRIRLVRILSILSALGSAPSNSSQMVEGFQVRGNSSPRAVLSLKEIGARRVLISKANLNVKVLVFSSLVGYRLRWISPSRLSAMCPRQTVGFPRVCETIVKARQSGQKEVSARRRCRAGSFNLFT